ncbi:MAG: hypothetical protein LBC58_05790 [Clostridiales Family XIII bacterium]|nr:hypothetical protein [Clostridiales Family XIII bacterium]
MKKLLAIITVLAMVLSLGTGPAFAWDPGPLVDGPSSEPSPPNPPLQEDIGDSTVTTTVSPTYTVTIPKNIPVSYDSTTEVAASLTPSHMVLDPGKKVAVYVKSDNAIGEVFRLINKNDDTSYATYNILKSDKNEKVQTGGVIAEFETGDETPYIFYVKPLSWDTVTSTGTYEDTLTFSLAYVNK